MLDSRLGTTIGDYLIFKLGRELVDQGHRLSGDLIRSLEFKVRTQAANLVIDFLSNEYGEELNTGVPASKIPRYPSVEYLRLVQALTRYATRRMGLRGKAAKRAGHAIVRAWQREGKPTRASYRFSKNGRRTGWVDYTLLNEEDTISEFVEDFVGVELEILITDFVKQAA